MKKIIKILIVLLLICWVVVNTTRTQKQQEKILDFTMQEINTNAKKIK